MSHYDDNGEPVDDDNGEPVDDDNGEPVDDDIDVLRDALCDVLRENVRKNMAGRIYAALLAKRVTTDQQDALLEEAVRSTDELLSKLERRR